jgi:hypothetical protein
LPFKFVVGKKKLFIFFSVIILSAISFVCTI